VKDPNPPGEPDPLRLVFPDPPASPVSAWRPPLYPTPWALAPYDHFFFARPIAADEVNWPLADYRYGGVFFERAVHTGIDIPVPADTPVLAAGPGKVIWAGYGLYSLIPGDAEDPYGLAIAIRHDFGYEGENLYTVYGHLDRIDVARGQHVQTGDLLGLTGETGKTTGPHLHFEVRIGKNNFFGSRNPELWLAPPQGWGLLAARVMLTAGELLPGQKIDVQSKESGQRWTVKTYGEGSANSDPYYRENLVLGDLPAGEYTVLIPYAGSLYNWDVAVRPGMVTYFTFRGKLGFKNDLPPDPRAVFNPDTWGKPASP
jgi:murein DD-endopeptidase MepM/ murein hydrolase activator NlpD